MSADLLGWMFAVCARVIWWVLSRHPWVAIGFVVAMSVSYQPTPEGKAATWAVVGCITAWRFVLMAVTARRKIAGRRRRPAPARQAKAPVAARVVSQVAVRRDRAAIARVTRRRLHAEVTLATAKRNLKELAPRD